MKSIQDLLSLKPATACGARTVSQTPMLDALDVISTAITHTSGLGLDLLPTLALILTEVPHPNYCLFGLKFHTNLSS